MSTRLRLACLAVVASLPATTLAQSSAWGRVSLLGQTVHTTRDDGFESNFTELAASLTLHSASAEEGGFEYGLDARGALYPSTNRDGRVSLYEAWAGGRTKGGVLGVRAGQMWINELGGLGSVGGLHLEVRPKKRSKAGRFRFGLFAGAEPKAFEAGYVSAVKKAGLYAALEGDRGRRHVVGYVVLRNGGLTERSVVSVSNFVPVGTQFFLYQMAEVDVSSAGKNGLNFLFATARYSPVKRVELSATYHRGRSIDTRTITQDLLNGVPVDSRTLYGFLYQSGGGRVTVEVIKNVRVYAGYAVDRSDRESTSVGRLTVGLHASNLAGSGFDLTVSDNRSNRNGGPNDAWYASIGRSIGPRVYLSLDASTSLAVFRFTDQGGVVIESRPRTKRFGLSGTANVSRHFSLMVTAEQFVDDVSRDTRGLLGVTYRF